MHLSVSNIIWEKGKDRFEDFLIALKNFDIIAVELSLNSIFAEPATILKSDIKWLNDLSEKYGISYSAFHTLTYTRPDLEFFSSSKKLIELYDYILRYRDFAEQLDIPNIVLGSPKARKLNGLSKTDANKIFFEFLKKLDSELANVKVCIEPLPLGQCEYLNTFSECVELIKTQSLANIGVLLDIRSAYESSEDLDSIFLNTERLGFLNHVQVSDPGLMAPSDKIGDWHHQLFSNLELINYQGYISAEVIPSNSNYLESLKHCVSQLRYFYSRKRVGE